MDHAFIGTDLPISVSSKLLWQQKVVLLGWPSAVICNLVNFYNRNRHSISRQPNEHCDHGPFPVQLPGHALLQVPHADALRRRSYRIRWYLWQPERQVDLRQRRLNDPNSLNLSDSDLPNHVCPVAEHLANDKETYRVLVAKQCVKNNEW